MYAFDEFFIGDINPMYVQRWRGPASPPEGSRHVVFIAGGAHSGVSWTTTPDGRPGWARLFAEAGWTSYVLDWPGVGRSRLEAGQKYAANEVLVERVAELLRRVGPSVVVAHSYGLPIVTKALDQAPRSVSRIVAIAPSAPGNVRRPEAPVDVEDAAWLAEADVLATLANAARFPYIAQQDYARSLTSYSPRIRNACGDRDGSGELVVDNVEALRLIPSLVLVGDEEKLASQKDIKDVATFLGGTLVRLKEDWGLPGHGHMIPVEEGTSAVVRNVLGWLSHEELRS